MILILPLLIVAFLGSVTPKVNFAYLEDSFREFDGIWQRYKLPANQMPNFNNPLKYQGTVNISFIDSSKFLQLVLKNKTQSRIQLLYGKVNTTSDEFHMFRSKTKNRPAFELKIIGYEQNYFITFVYKTLEESLQHSAFGYIWVYEKFQLSVAVVNLLKAQIIATNLSYLPQNFLSSTGF